MTTLRHELGSVARRVSKEIARNRERRRRILLVVSVMVVLVSLATTISVFRVRHSILSIPTPVVVPAATAIYTQHYLDLKTALDNGAFRKVAIETPSALTAGLTSTASTVTEGETIQNYLVLMEAFDHGDFRKVATDMPGLLSVGIRNRGARDYATLVLGVSLERTGRHKEAIPYLSALARDETMDLEHRSYAFSNLVWATTAVYGISAGAAVADEALRALPADARVLITSGHIYFDVGVQKKKNNMRILRKARNFYLLAAALAYERRRGEALNGVGRCDIRLGLPEEAREMFEAALCEIPGNPVILKNLGLAKLIIGRKGADRRQARSTPKAVP